MRRLRLVPVYLALPRVARSLAELHRRRVLVEVLPLTLHPLTPSPRKRGEGALSTAMIKIIRGQPVILDEDLAALYEVPTGALHQTVQRNLDRFPEDFSFVLTADEWRRLKSQNVIAKGRGGRRTAPRVFTEHGVTMLAGLLTSDKAIDISVMVVRGFVSMRRQLSAYGELSKRIDALEQSIGSEFADVWAALRLMLETPAKPQRQIGFTQVKERRREYALAEERRGRN